RRRHTRWPRDWSSDVCSSDLLGPENFFLEIQDHGIPDQQKIVPMMARLGEETGLRLVATNDSHYLHKDDAFAHEVLLCIGTGKRSEERRVGKERRSRVARGAG